MRPLREDEPLTEKRRKYVQTVNDNKGSRLDVEETWRNFVNDRISRSLLFGSHGAVDADWRKWVDREAKWFLERLGDKRDHKARMEKRYGDHVPKYEKPTGQQASNFQAELKKRLEEEAKKGAA